MKSVLIMVFDKGNPLLLKRSGAGTYKGVWEFPAGGMENGETPMQSAIRELNEETGIVRKRLKRMGILERDDIIFYVFKTNMREYENVVLSDEHDSFTLADIGNLRIGIDTENSLKRFWKK